MPLPVRGLVGAIGLVASEVFLFAGNGFVGRFFTPLEWSFYILLVDGILERMTGTSPLRRAPLHVLWTALASIGIWYLFEGYNLLMEGWRYVGLPENMTVRVVGYFWAFATIGPGMFVTRELVATLLSRGTNAPPRPVDRRSLPGPLAWTSVVVGAACLLSPFVVPPETARYLWAPVWAGFIFLVDPVNARLGRTSIWRDALARDGHRLASLLLAGLVCGGLWEMWNFWALTKWHYTFPFAGIEHLRLFEMPLVGFIGFPPFAVEYYALTELLSILWGGNADLDAPARRRPQRRDGELSTGQARPSIRS